MQFSDSEAEQIRNLLDRARRDPSFSKADTELLIEMVKVYRGIRVWGVGARFIVLALASLAGGLTAWEVINEKVRTWFGG